jgi:hypothetical protein
MILETIEDKKRFLASSEMCYDPMYQSSMDTMYHAWMQDKYNDIGWRKSMNLGHDKNRKVSTPSDRRQE